MLLMSGKNNIVGLLYTHLTVINYSGSVSVYIVYVA